MLVLPKRTRPPESPFQRRHDPEPSGDYREYRSCLRWEFGFTCPFCLLHEADLTGGYSQDGTGLVHIEHLEPQSLYPDLANDYSNVVLACRFCNQNRQAKKPRGEEGGRLLDPTRDAWAEHFKLQGDRLTPLTDAARSTLEAYKPNDERQKVRRSTRARFMEDRVSYLRWAPVKIRKLRSRAQSGDLESLDQCREMEKVWRLFRREVAAYCFVPADTPDSCRCGTTENHSLPANLESQGVELTLDPP